MEDKRIMLMAENSPKAMLEKIWGFDKDCQCKLILFLWCWWSARNKADSGESKRTAHMVINDVSFYFQAWRNANHLDKQPCISSGKSKWIAPPEDVYKINCDGAFITGSNKAGWGFIIRNHAGMVVAAGAGSANFLMSAQHAEATACLKGLEHAALLGMRRVILETDASAIAKALNDNCFERSVFANLLNEIKTFMYLEFSECTISHVSRGCNAVADILAAIGLNYTDGPLLWQDHVPDLVASLVSGDLPEPR
jgi:ribonuclease HI